MEMMNAASYMNNYYYQYWMNWMKQMANSGDSQVDPTAVGMPSMAGMSSMAGMTSMAGMPAEMISASGMPSMADMPPMANMSSMADMPSPTGMPSPPIAGMPMMDDADYSMPMMPHGMVPSQMGSPRPPPMGSPGPPGGMHGMMPRMPRRPNPMQMAPRPNRPRFNGNPDGYCNYGNPMYGGRPPRPPPPRPRPPMPRQMRPPRPNFPQSRMPQPTNYTPSPPCPAPPFHQTSHSPPSPSTGQSYTDHNPPPEPRRKEEQPAKFDRHGNPIKYRYIDDPPKTVTKPYTSACLYCDLHFRNKTEFFTHLRGLEHRIRLKQVALQLVTRVETESDAEAERRGEFCKICDHRFHCLSLEHMEDKEHLRKLRLVRRGCVLCKTGPFVKYPDYIEHLDTKDHKLKKFELDELTIERHRRRTHVRHERHSRRGHFLMEHPGDHIVLDAVGIFDEDHSSSGGDSIMSPSPQRSLSSDRRRSRERSGSRHRRTRRTRSNSHRSSSSPNHHRKRSRFTRWSRIDDDDDDDDDDDESHRSVSINGDTTDGEEKKSDSETEGDANQEENEKRSTDEEEFDYEEDVEEEDSAAKGQQREDVTVISDESDDEVIKHSTPKMPVMKTEPEAVESRSKKPLWSTTRTGRSTAMLLRRLRLMRQKNKRAIGRLLPDNTDRTTEPPNGTLQNQPDHAEQLTTHEASVKTQKMKCNLGGRASGKMTSMQEKDNEQTTAAGIPTMNNRAFGKTAKKTKIVQEIARETRQSSAKKDENSNACANDTHVIDGDSQQADGKHDQSQLKINHQNRSQATQPLYRVNESSIVEHVWAKQKLPDPTLKKTALKAKQAKPLTCQVNQNASPIRTTSENTEISDTLQTKPCLVKTTRKRVQTLTSTIVSVKKLQSEQTQKKRVIDETLPEATSEYLRSNHTAQDTNDVIEDHQQTSVKAKSRRIIQKQNKTGGQQKGAKTKSKANWAYLMLKRRMKESRPAVAAAKVKRVCDNAEAPSSDVLVDSLDELELAELKSKPALDKTTPGSTGERATTCQRNWIIKQTKKIGTQKSQLTNETEATDDAKPGMPGSPIKQAKKGNKVRPSSPVKATAERTLKATQVQLRVSGADPLEEQVKAKYKRVGRKSKQMKTASLDRSTTPDELDRAEENSCDSVMDESEPRQHEASDLALDEPCSPTKIKVQWIGKKLTQTNQRTVRRRSVSVESKSSQPDSTPKQTGQDCHDEPTGSAGGDRVSSDEAVKHATVESLGNEHMCSRAETGISHMIAANGLMKTRRLVIEVEQLTTIPGVHDISEIMQSARKGCLTRRNGRKRIGPKCMQKNRRAKQTSCENSDASVVVAADKGSKCNSRQNGQADITDTADNSDTGVSKPTPNATDNDCASDSDISLAELKAKETPQLDRRKENENVKSEPMSNTTHDERLHSESDTELKTKQDKHSDHNREIDAIKQESAPSVPAAVLSDTDSSVAQLEGSRCDHPDQNKANDTVKQEPPACPPDNESVLTDTDVSLTHRRASEDEQSGQSNLSNTVKHEPASDHIDGERVASNKDVSTRPPRSNDVEQADDNSVLDKVKQEPNTPDESNDVSPADTTVPEVGSHESERLHNSNSNDNVPQTPTSDMMQDESVLSDTSTVVAERSNNEDQPIGPVNYNAKANRQVIRLRRMPFLKAKRTTLRRLRRNLAVSRIAGVNRETATDKTEPSAQPEENTADGEQSSITPSVENTSSARSITLGNLEQEEPQESNALPMQDAHKTLIEASPPSVTDRDDGVHNNEVRPLVYPYDDEDQEANNQEDQVGHINEEVPQTPPEDSNIVSSFDANGENTKQPESSGFEHDDTEDSTNQTATAVCQDTESGIHTNESAAEDNVPTTESPSSVDAEKRAEHPAMTDNAERPETKHSDDEDISSENKTTHPEDGVSENEQPHCTQPQPEETADRAVDGPPLLAPEMPVCETQDRGPADGNTIPPEPVKERDITISRTTESSDPAPPDLTRPDDLSFDPQTSIGQQYVVQVSGYFCRLCHKFYTNEDMAKTAHCRTEKHFEKYQCHLKTKEQRKNKNSELPTDSTSRT